MEIRKCNHSSTHDTAKHLVVIYTKNVRRVKSNALLMLLCLHWSGVVGGNVCALGRAFGYPFDIPRCRRGWLKCVNGPTYLTLVSGLPPSTLECTWFFEQARRMAVVLCGHLCKVVS